MENESNILISTGDKQLAFEVGAQSYAIDTGAVREIRGWTELSGMPHADPHLMGVINLRGEMLPLLGLAAKLGLQTPEINERSVIIIVEEQEAVFGLLVDSVSNIIAPPAEDVKPPPEAAKSGVAAYVSALTLVEDNLTRILDVSALLNASQPLLVEAS
ncbi:MAG: chemotaxis protein CheW [Pseudomonadota bacterium]